MTSGNLETRVSTLETQMQEAMQLATLTAQNVANLQASQRQTDQQLQHFIRESTRVIASISDTSSRADAAATANRELLQRLVNKAESIEGRLGDLVEYVRNRGL